MKLAKFLNLCAMILGVIATLFLSKALFESAEQILRATYHYSPMGWPSVAIISDKAGQKADTMASIILVFLALILQICSLFIKEDISFRFTWLKGVIYAIIFVVIVSVIVYNIDGGARKNFENEIKMLAARDRIKLYFEKRSCPLYSDVEAIAKQYFNFCKEANENNPDFVKRFACFLDYSIPKDADFSKFR